MSSLQVVFDVPAQIVAGLMSGTLQRVGGVIVESSTKQVVAWLRDANVIDQVLNTGGSLPSPLSIILNAGRVGVSLIDGHLTRQSIGQVSQHIAAISQEVQVAKTIASFTASGQVVNLALSAVTFHATMQRLERLSVEIAKLGDLIRAEFARDRDLEFRAALQAARDVLETSSAEHRSRSINDAILGLLKSRENFLHDFQELLEGEATTERLMAAQHTLIRAIYAETNRIRCYLATDDLEMTLRRLKEDMPKFQNYVFLLARAWLGNHPALFLHKDVNKPDVERFLNVAAWLRHDGNIPSTPDAHTLFHILDEVRSDFWMPNLVEDRYDSVLGQITRRPIETFDTHRERLVANLDYAEILIENFQRLQGFELELRSIRLESFDEWQQLINEEDIARYGLGIIYDAEKLDSL